MECTLRGTGKTLEIRWGMKLHMMDLSTAVWLTIKALLIRPSIITPTPPSPRLMWAPDILSLLLPSPLYPPHFGEQKGIPSKLWLAMVPILYQGKKHVAIYTQHIAVMFHLRGRILEKLDRVLFEIHDLKCAPLSIIFSPSPYEARKW